MNRTICLSIVFLALLASASLFDAPDAGAADCYNWPLRRGPGARLIEDADTLYVTVPGLPAALSQLSIQVRGVTAPRTRFGECAMEKKRGLDARAFTLKILSTAKVVKFCDPKWDGETNRILASVKIDAFDLAEVLVEKGFGRIPVEGKKVSWCIR